MPKNPHWMKATPTWLSDMAAKFRINKPMGDEGPVEFFVGEAQVGGCDYDRSGWQGMEDQTVMFKKIAEALRSPVKTTFIEQKDWN